MCKVSKPVFIYIFSIFLLCTEAFAKRNFEFNITKIECISHDTIASDVFCNIGEIVVISGRSSKLRRVINTNVTLKRQVPELRLHFLLSALRSSSEIAFKIMEIDMRFCDLINDKGAGNLQRLLLQTADKYMNQLLKCPLEVNSAYVLKDFYINPDDFPTYTPEGLLKFELLFRAQDTKLWDVCGVMNVVNTQNSLKKLIRIRENVVKNKF